MLKNGDISEYIQDSSREDSQKVFDDKN